LGPADKWPHSSARREDAMDFKLQAFGPFLHWLTLIILCVVPVLLAYVIYRLGRLPGEVARSRNHPQAEAINICGWMGVITLVLWPLALVWAYLKSDKPLTGGSAAEVDNKALIDKLREARQRLAALEDRLPQQRAGG
jgi:cytochrome b561